jgi:hypothetical protein
MTNRLTPVAVVGLGSGVANIALGPVRFVFGASLFMPLWLYVAALRAVVRVGIFLYICLLYVWLLWCAWFAIGEVHAVDYPLWLCCAVA